MKFSPCPASMESVSTNDLLDQWDVGRPTTLRSFKSWIRIEKTRRTNIFMAFPPVTPGHAACLDREGRAMDQSERRLGKPFIQSKSVVDAVRRLALSNDVVRPWKFKMALIHGSLRRHLMLFSLNAIKSMKLANAHRQPSFRRRLLQGRLTHECASLLCFFHGNLLRHSHIQLLSRPGRTEEESGRVAFHLSVYGKPERRSRSRLVARSRFLCVWVNGGGSKVESWGSKRSRQVKLRVRPSLQGKKSYRVSRAD